MENIITEFRVIETDDGFHPMMWMKMAHCYGPWDYEAKEKEA